jgi:prepilin peptidase CpaA
MTTAQFFLLAASALCAVGALCDLRTGQIPNWLTFGALLGAPALHGILAFAHHRGGDAVAASLLASIGGAIVAALLPLLLWYRGGLGLGDAKLFAALGAMCGAFVALYAQTYAYAVAFVYALVMLARRGEIARTLGNVGRLVSSSRGGAAAATVEGAAARNEGFTEVRFGPAIFAGMCIAAYARWRG